jgi:CheY-like chemotaxis protein
VLVTEDEFFIRAAVADELRAAGYSVLEVMNSAEALELLAAHREIALLFPTRDDFNCRWFLKAQRGIEIAELIASDLECHSLIGFEKG